MILILAADKLSKDVKRPLQDVFKAKNITAKELDLTPLRLRMDVGVLDEATAALLRKTVFDFCAPLEIDAGLIKDSAFKAEKKLFLTDLDSTLIQAETVDELAKHASAEAGKRVAEITERAMRGEIEYDQSLRERVACLKGLPESILRETAAKFPLTKGATTLIHKLRSRGCITGLVSGGFDVCAEAFIKSLKLHESRLNKLEVVDGKLTGRMVNDAAIINGARKREFLAELAGKHGIGMDETVAIGDGANDIPMIQAAGIGIAFRAKPKTREAADVSIVRQNLMAVLDFIT